MTSNNYMERHPCRSSEEQEAELNAAQRFQFVWMVTVNSNLVEWLNRRDRHLARGAALVVGCGLGDDAEYLASRGFRVTAFDISPIAIAWCRRRFPESAVEYVIADLFRPPGGWDRAFDLVVEAYTLQVLPAELRGPAMRQMAPWVSPSGVLLVISRGRDAD